MVVACVGIVFCRRQLLSAPWNVPRDYETDLVVGQLPKNVMLMKPGNVSGFAFMRSRSKWEERSG